MQERREKYGVISLLLISLQEEVMLRVFVVLSSKATND